MQVMGAAWRPQDVGRWLFGGLIAAASMPAAAQIASPALPPSASRVTPREIAPPEPSMPSDTKVAPPSAQTRPGIAPPGSEALTFTPSEIAVQDGLPAMAAAERALVAPYAGKTMSVAQLYAVAAQLEAAYARAGYIFVRVLAPPQRIESGRPALIRVIDGFIEAVDVSKVPARYQYPVRRTLAPLIGKRGVTQAEIERRLTIAADLPGIRLASTLIAGKQLGGTRLVINAEGQKISGSITFDNRTSGAFGGREFTTQVAANSLFGDGEQIYLFTSADPGVGLTRFLRTGAPRRVFGGGVILPLDGNGTRLTLEEVHSITEPLGGFFLTRGIYNKVAARVSHPLIRSHLRQLLGTLSVERLVESQEAPQFGVDLFLDRYIVLRGALDYSWQGKRRALALDGALVGGFGSTATTAPLSRAGATQRYSKFEGSAQASQALPIGFRLLGVVHGQKLITGGVPSSELFSLDGEDALSPFTSGALSADEGVTARIALQRPVRMGPGVTVTPGLYAASGWAWYSVPTAFDIPRAKAFGGTLDLALRPRGWVPTLTAALDYGHRKLPGFLADNRFSVSVALRI